MAGPRHSFRLGSRPKTTAKSMKIVKKPKTAKEPQKPFPLMELNDKILTRIINEVEKGEPYLMVSCELGLESRLFCLDDLKNLSLVNKRLRELMTPTLFKYARITDFVNSVSTGQYTVRRSLIETLEIVAKKPLILKAIQYLIVETKLCEFSYHYDTPDALWKCLELMPNLKEISLRVCGSYVLQPLLESHLAHNPKLPVLNTVRSISLLCPESDNTPGYDVSKFLKLTPNVENVSIDISDGVDSDCLRLVAVSKLPRLKYLMLCRAVSRPRRSNEALGRENANPFGWAINDIEFIAKMVPDIPYLALVGQLDDAREDARISDFIPAFAGFKKLERLDMTDEFVVKRSVVESTLPEGTNIDDSDHDFDAVSLGKDMAHRSPLNEERPKVARKFFETCPTLRQVYLTRCEKGELFGRGDGDGLVVQMVQSVVAGESHEFALGFPRVLELNDLQEAHSHANEVSLYGVTEMSGQ